MLEKTALTKSKEKHIGKSVVVFLHSNLNFSLENAINTFYNLLIL